jgi:hypothetical protein
VYGTITHELPRASPKLNIERLRHQLDGQVLACISAELRPELPSPAVLAALAEVDGECDPQRPPHDVVMRKHTLSF